MKSTCPRTRILTIFFLSVLFLTTASFAHSELVLTKTGDYNTNDNVTCFDYYNGTIYMALESNRYLPMLSYPNLESSERVSQDFNINCINAMSDGRVIYITKRAVYQTLPTVGELFEFYNIQEMRDYKGGYVLLTGYNNIYGIDKNGNMTLGLPFEYRLHNFTGIGTDGSLVYASDNESKLFVLDSDFDVRKTINLSCTCPIRNLYVYGKGDTLEILLTGSDSIYLIRDDVEYRISDDAMDRCIIVGYDNIMCSKGKYLNFFNVTNVSNKIEKYANATLPLEIILANSTNCSYAAWVSEQLSKAESTRDIDEALKIVQNLSMTDLLSEECIKKVVEEAIPTNTTNATVLHNTSTGGKNGTGNVTTNSQAQLGEFPLLAIIVIAILIAAVAYLLLKRKPARESGYSRANR